MIDFEFNNEKYGFTYHEAAGCIIYNKKHGLMFLRDVFDDKIIWPDPDHYFCKEVQIICDRILKNKAFW